MSETMAAKSIPERNLEVNGLHPVFASRVVLVAEQNPSPLEGLASLWPSNRILKKYFQWQLRQLIKLCVQRLSVQVAMTRK